MLQLTFLLCIGFLVTQRFDFLFMNWTTIDFVTRQNVTEIHFRDPADGLRALRNCAFPLQC